MADINLLPDEFRRKEEKERSQTRKKPRVIEVDLTDPEKSKAVAGKGFWKKLFGLKDQKAAFRKRQKPSAASPAVKITSVKDAEHPKETEEVHKPSSDDVKKISKHIHEIPQEKAQPEVKVPKTVSPLPSSESQEAKRITQFKVIEPKKQQEEARLLKKGERVAEGKLLKKEIVPDYKKGIRPSLWWQKIRKTIYKLIKKTPHKKTVEVNLMPEGVITFREVNWSKIMGVLLLSIIVAGLITVVGYLSLWNRRQTEEMTFADLRLEIARLENAISSLEEEERLVFLLQKKLQIAGELIDNHIYWTKFFDLLEKYTLDDVFYSNFSARAEEGDIILSGSAENLSTLFWQREMLRDAKDFVSSVEVGQIAVEPASGSVNFVLTAHIKPSVWHK